jgi:hypothetical protein
MRSVVGIIAALGVCVTGALAACSKGTDPVSADPSILVEKDVNVGSNGGAAYVTFTGTSGVVIRITLTATSSSLLSIANTTGMQPYGALESPSGASEYTPHLINVQSGHNTSDVSLTESGRYTFTIFDGSGAGGTIHVKIQKIS